MGCWKQTCSISNLPIAYKDKIVIIPLMLISDDIKGLDGLLYDVNDKYCSFCVPVIGSYNDYGGIEEIENEDFILSILNNYKFVIENEKEEVLETLKPITSVEDFFDIILEKNLSVEIYKKRYKVNYIICHYDLFVSLIKEVSNRFVNFKRETTYRILLKDKIEKFVLVASNRENNKTKEKLLDGLEELCADVLNDFDENERKKFLKDLSSPSCYLRFVSNYLQGYLYDILIRLLIYKKKNNQDDIFVLNTFLDMLVLDRALALLRKGYLINTGLGHQGYELKLHLVICDFVDSYINKYINRLLKDNCTKEEIENYLEERILWYE